MVGNSLNSNANQVGIIKNKKILFVDGSKRIRDALSLFFEFEDCDFVSRETPAEALEELQNHAYDIIIADYCLSGFNGLEFLNFVKSNFPQTIGLLTTFCSNKKFVEEAKAAGISKVIQKPFSGESLLLNLSQIFEKASEE